MKKADRRKLAVELLKGAKTRIEPARKWVRRVEIKAKGMGCMTVLEAKEEGLLPGPNDPDLNGAFCAYGAMAYEAHRRGFDDEVLREAVAMMTEAIDAHPLGGGYTPLYEDESKIFFFNDRNAKSKKDVLDMFDKAINKK